ncbi:MAG: DUF4097 family beta strand repeat-containing protein [Lachnospiraceae bacterium]
MKKFTKIALIATLVLTILGGACCIAGAVIGFNYTEFKSMVKQGAFQVRTPYWAWDEKEEETYDTSNWKEAVTQRYDFSPEECSTVENFTMDVSYGEVNIEENENTQGISVEVEYRKANHRSEMIAALEGNTLKINETENHHDRNKDTLVITVQIPKDKVFQTIDLKQDAGSIMVDVPLNAKNISLNVSAGECDVYQILTASEKLQANVEAGEIDLNKIKAGTMELKAGIGDITVEEANADQVMIDTGIGSVDTVMEGKETDYSYKIDCGVGDVEVGSNQYSTLGSTKNVRNDGKKKMDISCGVGEVSVDFTK